MLIELTSEERTRITKRVSELEHLFRLIIEEILIDDDRTIYIVYHYKKPRDAVPLGISKKDTHERTEQKDHISILLHNWMDYDVENKGRDVCRDGGSGVIFFVHPLYGNCNLMENIRSAWRVEIFDQRERKIYLYRLDLDDFPYHSSDDRSWVETQVERADVLTHEQIQHQEELASRKRDDEYFAEVMKSRNENEANG